ncbi:MAG TPA: hypothetical protein VK168_16345 [Saprospiraceae bacterium]|nr:hypothetical protein [Saprospiraceae bacterium]
MKHNTQFSGLAGVVCLAFLLASIGCGPKCDNGYERSKDDCICPEGRFEIADECLALAENQFYWQVDCPCMQEPAVVSFIPETALGVQLLRFEVKWGAETVTVYNKAGLSTDTVSTGASFAKEECKINGKVCDVRFQGRLVHPDTLRGELVYYDAFIDTLVIDRCPAQMWRK